MVNPVDEQRTALICYRVPETGTITAEWTYWTSREQARQAEAELTPCGPLCVGIHSIVRLDRPSDRRRTLGRIARPT